MKIRIKQVPNNEPNADGEWVVKEVDKDKFVGNCVYSKVWRFLNEVCDEGYHAVDYRLKKTQEICTRS